ncbi:expressed protein [Echinococcus multilocularis]|uniref:Expressed protein n=1 Tax=Echinococcus multilocularis TaxID=6211 RepID=A0A087VXR5_ECHMU|nr:expressed protein [Echinococcus multilocularis]
MESRSRRRSRSRNRERPYEITISTADMSSKMQTFIMEQVIECLNNRSHPKKMCRYIRERCNERYGPSWDCFVAREYYGSFAYVPRHLLGFELNGLNFLIFKGA